MLKIVIGNKNYSSWSMRAWVALKQTGAPFEEVLVPLDTPQTAEGIAKHSAAGKVPVLIDAGVTVWDSLAICEYLAEKFPEAKLWPEEREKRAVARSVCAEMHSGFQALRNDCPMKIKARLPVGTMRPELAADVQRVSNLFAGTRKQYGSGGPYLFGAFSNADAFFAPVAARVKTYALPLEPAAQEYVDALWAAPAVKAWVDGALAEQLEVPRYEQKK